MKPSTHVMVVLIIASILCPALIGCSASVAQSGPSTDPEAGSLTITGRLGSGFSVARRSTGSRSIAGAVSHIASIPVIAGSPDLGQVQNTAIASNGSFSVALTPQANASTLLLLVNEHATTLEEKAVGFASLKSDNGADLLLFPFDLASRSMDFGTLNLSNGMAVSSSSLESQQDAFTLAFDELLQTAYHDNLFKCVKNQYVNTSPDSYKGYWVRTRCKFESQLELATNEWNPISSWTWTPGFNVRIDVTDPDGYQFQDVADGIVDLEVVPPQTFTIPTVSGPPLVISPSNPVLASMAFGDTYKRPNASLWVMNDPASPGTEGFLFEFDGEENLVNGNWKMNLVRGGTRTELALFDMQSIVPFTADGSFIYYLPSVRAVTDASGKITRIDMTWFAWNPFMNMYERVTDMSTFMRLVRNFNLTITDYTTDEESFVNMLAMTPAKKWYIGNTIPPGGLETVAIGAGYEIAGVEYGFRLMPAP